MKKVTDLSAFSFDERLVEQPEVANPGRSRGGKIGYGATVLAGAVVLLVLTTQRHERENDTLIPAANAASAQFVKPLPLPTGSISNGVTMVRTGLTVPAPQFTVDNQVKMPMSMGDLPNPAPSLTGASGMTAAAPVVGGVSLRNVPAMIVDLSDTGQTGVVVGAKSSDPAPGNPSLVGSGKSTGSDDGQFLQATSFSSAPASATRIGKLDQVVAEGTVLSATLETAINSDLPGMARAVISRDVTSFDASRVLIPRGSRVIGQYKSGVAMGGSRVFIIWTRLIRPDGVSIQLASPGGDDLGRGGLAGKTDRHFLQRFGGSLLTTILNGAVQIGSASLGGNLPVYINTAADASTAASSAAKSGDIAPTVRTPQGVAVRIFVSRDLDFSSVQIAR